MVRESIELIQLPDAEEADMLRAQVILGMVSRLGGYQSHPGLANTWVFGLGQTPVQLCFAHESTGRDLHLPRDHRQPPRAIGKARLVAINPLNNEPQDLDQIEVMLRHMLAEREALEADRQKARPIKAALASPPQMLDVLADIAATLHRIEDLLQPTPAPRTADAERRAA